jgi:hypothetical protein
MNKKSKQPGSGVCIPWPRKGDKLFSSAPDWFNACLNFAPTSWQWYAYAKGYKLAADLAVEHVAKTRQDQDIVIYPVVFLYRHYVELMFKSLIYDLGTLLRRPVKVPEHHDLHKIWQRCLPLLLDAVPSTTRGDAEAVGQYVEQFCKVDRASTAFRYPQDKAGGPSLPGLTHVNLANLREVIDRLYTFLDAASCAVGAGLDAMAEAEGYLGGNSLR